ncbi:Segregation and condensation protein A [hydrothermal vent metagenome]|uniref:Segregation and condensation protein A n=1 Tax=hydrothermal vent metagenome TaxID=652676 RepID=A0A3B0ZEN8_9ZZZZ
MTTSVTEPVQTEMVLATVNGAPVLSFPQDLYIPPDALEVFLEAFEGPLDLLLYLIKRQNLDVLDIPIAEITKQYMNYIDLMGEIRLELAAEYLVMAAMLAEIKSRMLLPRPIASDDEDDPRADLVRRLQEYERFKQAAEDLNELPRMGRDTFPGVVAPPAKESEAPLPTVELKDLLFALKDVIKRADMYTHHRITQETLSVRERMSKVLSIISADSFTEFASLFTIEEGRMGVVVSLLAILELVKESVLELLQSEPFGPIYVKARQSVNESTAT